VIVIGGTPKVCKYTGSACADGTLTEATCAVNNNYQYHWKETACVKCESANTEEPGNATVIALGLLSFLALIN